LEIRFKRDLNYQLLRMNYEKIKYKNTNQEFATELRNTVNQYFENRGISKQGGTQIIIKTAIMISVYFVPYSLMMTGLLTTVFSVLIAWFIMGIGMSGLGVATMHDANHGSFSKYTWVNKLFEKSLYVLGGLPAIGNISTIRCIMVIQMWKDTMRI
jgi:linoleoyl-CoA desaturase